MEPYGEEDQGKSEREKMNNKTKFASIIAEVIERGIGKESIIKGNIAVWHEEVFRTCLYSKHFIKSEHLANEIAKILVKKLTSLGRIEFCELSASARKTFKSTTVNSNGVIIHLVEDFDTRSREEKFGIIVIVRQRIGDHNTTSRS